MSFDLDHWLSDLSGEVEGWLRSWVDQRRRDPAVTEALSSAMAHALLSGGKRLRPALVVASAEAVGGSRAGAPGERPLLLRDACCAVELIHNYSLAHDDLPSMDDDDLRRGKPTCHKVHGEAMAILAGDGLLTDAFSVLSRGLLLDREASSEGGDGASARLRLVARLSRAAGSGGMVGGQAMDIGRTAVGAGLDEVERVHRSKTGALFAYSCAAGAEAVGAPSDRVDSLARFGETIGLAFQVVDDILDETGEAERVGKRVGKDLDRDTATVTRVIGLDAARKRADGLVDEALSTISEIGGGSAALTALAMRLVRRNA